MLNSPSRIRRGLFAAFAAFAVALVLLRPVCELSAAHAGVGAASAPAGVLGAGIATGHGEAAQQCCDSVTDPGAPASLLAASAAIQFSPEFVPAVSVVVATVSALLVRQLQWLRAPPLPSQSFYVRSARILR
jgi:hypothetical protein